MPSFRARNTKIWSPALRGLDQKDAASEGSNLLEALTIPNVEVEHQ